jgi:hypothetical protein
LLRLLRCACGRLRSLADPLREPTPPLPNVGTIRHSNFQVDFCPGVLTQETFCPQQIDHANFGNQFWPQNFGPEIIQPTSKRLNAFWFGNLTGKFTMENNLAL